jgi:5,10-methylenetetrahydromethanopterin reductase
MAGKSGSRDARKLGAYILPGGVSDPRPAIEQARAADELGLGTIWLSERWGTKDVPVIFGALSQTTSTVKLGSGTTHFQDRHPLILASTAAALQSFSDGRFLLGVGKLTPGLWEGAGVPDATNAVLADTADIIRRLLRGETVSYDGPAGRFPELRLMGVLDVPPPPILITAIGPKTLDVAGRHFDGAILHAFLTPEAVKRSVERIRVAAANAGREPNDVRIYGMVVVASDLSVEQESRIVAARAVTYFDTDPLGSIIFEANRWDKAPLMALRSHPLVTALGGQYADFGLTPDQRVEVGKTIPEEWLRETSAIGTPEACAARLHEFLDAGADELILHGSTPDMLAPVIEAFVAARR